MPGKEEVAITTGMRTANGLIVTRSRPAGLDFCLLEHALVKILVAGISIIDMVLLRICSTINQIVTTVQSTAIIIIFL